MTREEKAKIILEQIANHININWNLEHFYLKDIMTALKEIESLENNEVME